MTTTTPNMNLVLPDVSVTAGPQWATLLNAAYALIDSHDHTTGNGVKVTPAGLNISSDLTFAQNNATNLRTVRLYPNNSFTPSVSDRTCLYALSGELYYIDANGNNVQLTLNGAVDISGSITALSLKDSSFFIQYFGDITRQFRFNASAIPTGTTRILSVPDSGANDTFVTQAASQVLTNKTLTTPIIASINTGSVTFALPAADGTSGQVIQTNGTGTLSFVAAATTVGNVAANDSNVTFTSTDNRTQFCTPTAPRTYTLPTTGITAGDTWTFYNNATSSANYVTLQSSGANAIIVVPPQGRVILYAAVATPTTAANWVVLNRNSKMVAYTPTIVGYGTPTNLAANYSMRDNTVIVRIYYNIGTPTAVTGTISLPPGLTIDTSKILIASSSGSGGTQAIGSYSANRTDISGPMVVETSTSTSLIYFGGTYHSTPLTNVTNTNGLFTAGDPISITFEVPVL